MSQGIIQKFLSKRSENKALKDNWRTTKIIPDISVCVDLILKNQNAICITVDFRAKYYVDENLDIDGNSLMKVVDGDFYGDYVAFPYEENSPFAEKHDETMKVIITESGIENHLKYLETKPKIIETKIERFRDPLLNYRILTVFIVGCTLSVLSFSLEILSKKYEKKLSNVVNRLLKK